MVRNGEFGMEDVRRVLRKGWWIIPIFLVAGGGLGLLIATFLPKEYTSQTLVLVAKPTVPTEYVKPVVTEDLNRRLASMQEQILSRTRLEPVIEQFGLYHEDRNKVHVEELIDRLRKAIEISPLAPMAGTEDRSMPGFSVKVTFNNPQSAQQICTSITSMFMEQNASALEQQAVRTTSFLSEELDKAKAKLDQQDAKLAQFKRFGSAGSNLEGLSNRAEPRNNGKPGSDSSGATHRSRRSLYPKASRCDQEKESARGTQKENGGDAGNRQSFQRETSIRRTASDSAASSEFTATGSQHC